MDRRASEVETVPGHPSVIRGLRSLVVVGDEEDWPPMFHVVDLPGLILVSGQVRAQMTSWSTAPGEFVAVEDYRRGLV